MKFLAAEIMFRAGANVVCLTTDGTIDYDLHGDEDGSRFRRGWKEDFAKPMATFLDRMVVNPGFNVVVASGGDFNRSVPKADHASSTSVAVFGNSVKQGILNPIDDDARPPATRPARRGCGRTSTARCGRGRSICSAATPPTLRCSSNLGPDRACQDAQINGDRAARREDPPGDGRPRALPRRHERDRRRSARRFPHEEWCAPRRGLVRSAGNCARARRHRGLPAAVISCFERDIAVTDSTRTSRSPAKGG